MNFSKNTQSGGESIIFTTSASGGGQTISSGGDHRHEMFTATGFQTASNLNSSVKLRAASGNTITVDSDTAASKRLK